MVATNKYDTDFHNITRCIYCCNFDKSLKSILD